LAPFGDVDPSSSTRKDRATTSGRPSQTVPSARPVSSRSPPVIFCLCSTCIA